jgi:hypothetical protein
LKEAKNQFEILWVDSGVMPQCPPRPEYPDGVDIDASRGQFLACVTPLDYPAPRVGYYQIKCRICGRNLAVTTAGRPDDPRSIKVPCAPMTGRKH